VRLPVFASYLPDNLTSARAFVRHGLSPLISSPGAVLSCRSSSKERNAARTARGTASKAIRSTNIKATEPGNGVALRTFKPVPCHHHFSELRTVEFFGAKESRRRE